MSHYDYINKYSPYDNIEPDIDYPNYYVTGGLHDNRVAYCESAKFVAKLRYSQKEGTKRLQLLDTKLDDGHLSASDRYRHVKDIAKKYLFLLTSISKTYLKIQPPTDIADMTRSSSTTNINDAK
jgi:oligopeptidase B